jgi:hypothetical protein
MVTTTDEVDIPFYKAPDDTVRPGDVVRLSPNLSALKPPLVHVASNKAVRSGRLTAELLGAASGGTVPAVIADGKKETELVFKGKLDLALLLTRGCDIDHGKVRQLAAIRPLTEMQKEEDKIAVIEGKHVGLHYLPRATLPSSGETLFDESFVDFRYIVTVHAEFFATLTRPLALTREGLLDLYFSWMRHTIGKEIPPTLTCATCRKPVTIFTEVAAMIEPPPDY